MSSSIKVSVITPVYNASSTLRATIDSVLNQSLKEIEMLCVDDASTDNSLSILEEYAKADSRVRVFQQPNSGPGVARNKGIDMARGKYIAFLDSDDIMTPQMLQKLYERAEAQNADVTCCLISCFEETPAETFPNPRKWTPQIRAGLNTNLFCPRKERPRKLFQLDSASAWDKLWRTEFVKRVNLRFLPVRQSEDVPFVYLGLAAAERMTLVDESLLLYRMSNKSLSHKKDKDARGFMEAYRSLREQLIEKGYASDDVIASLDYNLFTNLVWFATDVSRPICRQLQKMLINEYEPIFHLHRRGAQFYMPQRIGFQILTSLVKPTISYIVPCLAKASRLRRSLESIHAQSIVNFEVICILPPGEKYSKQKQVVEAAEQKNFRFIPVEYPKGEPVNYKSLCEFAKQVAKSKNLVFVPSYLPEFYEDMHVKMLEHLPAEEETETRVLNVPESSMYSLSPLNPFKRKYKEKTTYCVFWLGIWSICKRENGVDYQLFGIKVYSKEQANK